MEPDPQPLIRDCPLLIQPWAKVRPVYDPHFFDGRAIFWREFLEETTNLPRKLDPKLIVREHAANAI